MGIGVREEENCTNEYIIQPWTNYLSFLSFCCLQYRNEIIAYSLQGCSECQIREGMDISDLQ